ncbi:CDP-glycerol glycerophosphotransferase family protein [Methanofollis sp. W23]|uniref:CDP-glycerol glycerophosphotransferase family protein n=1 Tax=Methanofollis sp. W23 TaxID=2817849 RepID=UPI0032B008C2
MFILSESSNLCSTQRVWKSSVRNALKGLFFRTLRTLNAIIPKKDNQILFASVPDYSDNAKALYEYVVKNHKHLQYDIIWLVNDPKILQILNQEKINAHLNMSICGLCCLLRSKYIIGTHNHGSRVKVKNQYQINLWHGMPLKSMGYMMDSATDDVLKDVKIGGDANDMLVATSSTTRNALAASFLTDPRKIVVTGQPRNDYLFMKADKRHRLARLLEMDLSKYRRLLLYMPTFRVGYGRVDGIPEHLDILMSESFNKFLEDNNILFVLKMHPSEEYYPFSQDKVKQCNRNVVILKTECLDNHLTSIYEILQDFDILITDYSSIYFDFLLLNRPIIFFAFDLEQYRQNRGFSLEPYDFWAPGPKVTTIETLVEEIQKCISNPDYYEKERKTVNNLINQFQDGNSCERVWEQILYKVRSQ